MGNEQAKVGGGICSQALLDHVCCGEKSRQRTAAARTAQGLKSPNQLSASNWRQRHPNLQFSFGGLGPDGEVQVENKYFLIDEHLYSLDG